MHRQKSTRARIHTGIHLGTIMHIHLSYAYFTHTHTHTHTHTYVYIYIYIYESYFFVHAFKNHYAKQTCASLHNWHEITLCTYVYTHAHIHVLMENACADSTLSIWG